MSLEVYKGSTTEPEGVWNLVTVVGNGAGSPNKTYGRGIAVTRTAVGVYLFTWADPPGNFVGYNGELQGTVPSSLAGYTTVLGAFTPATSAVKASVTISIFSSTFAAVDLTAAQTLCAFFFTKRAGATV